MDANVKEKGKKQIELIIKNLEKRNMKGHYCEDAAAAKALLAERFNAARDEAKKENRELLISWGGSMTLSEAGIKDWLAENGFNALDPYVADPAESYKRKVQALDSDIFLMSTNAITLDGELVNIDGNGNRLAALLFGPKKVFVVTGVNKVTENAEAALARVKSCAAPANAIRLSRKTPCSVTGKCGECLTAGQTICANTVTTRFSTTPGRVEVFLINEDLGY